MAGHIHGLDTEAGKAAIEYLAEELWAFHVTELLPLYVGVWAVDDWDWKKIPPKGRTKFVNGVISVLEEIADDHGGDVRLAWL